MKHLFVPYELAVKLKEKGFDENCFGFYTENLKLCSANLNNINRADKFYISAPLYQQVIDWFREKHKIWLDIESAYSWVDSRKNTEYVCWATYDRGIEPDENQTIMLLIMKH